MPRRQRVVVHDEHTSHVHQSRRCLATWTKVPAT
jgi:hypothetical protein